MALAMQSACTLLQVKGSGLKGRGRPPVVTSSFRQTSQEPRPSLEFHALSLFLGTWMGRGARVVVGQHQGVRAGLGVGAG